MNSFFSKIKQAVVATSNKISVGITNIFINKKLDAETIEELENLLISADLGAATSSNIVSQIKNIKFEKNFDIKLVQAKIADIISEILTINHKEFNLNIGSLNIFLFCGVNGNGKTTTIGKLAYLYSQQGRNVVVAACDTFRAAASDQLKVWTERASQSIKGAKGSCTLITGAESADPASVAFKASSFAKENNADILMIDTAGRLQNKQNLMEELAKICKVIEKAVGKTPDHSLLVLDATTGQNAYSQVEQFSKIAKINGLIITKLDGTAKAGVIVGLSDLYKLPIYFLGIGESIDDLKKFEPKDFANAIVGL